MTESEAEGVPKTFLAPTQTIGESTRRNVFAYEKQKAVLKTRRSDLSNRFNSSEEALQKIQEEQKDKQKVLEALRNVGLNTEIVPPVSFVVHDGIQTGKEFSEVQRSVNNGVTLRQNKLKILSLKDEELRKLEKIFKANIQMWRTNNNVIDILGSPSSSPGKAAKLVRRLLPLFYSENIMVDGAGKVHFVDTGVLTKYTAGRLFNIARNLEVVGSALSLGIINGILALRKARMIQ